MRAVAASLDMAAPRYLTLSTNSLPKSSIRSGNPCAAAEHQDAPAADAHQQIGLRGRGFPVATNVPVKLGRNQQALLRMDLAEQRELQERQRFHHHRIGGPGRD